MRFKSMYKSLKSKPTNYYSFNLKTYNMQTQAIVDDKNIF